MQAEWLLYIPFWLNLYEHGAESVCFRSHLYIPFWLNLYPDAEATTEEGLQTLHSILVKSIPFLTGDTTNMAWNFTFHSG